MIRQGVVHEKAADLAAMNQLPPLSMLPQWSRINTLDKARYPKAFIKDKHQAILDEAKQKREDDDDKDTEVTEMNPAQRIQYLERSILFLRQQHHEVLRCLHEEIDNLKKENKDMNFKMVMSQTGGRRSSDGTKSGRGKQKDKQEDKDSSGPSEHGHDSDKKSDIDQSLLDTSSLAREDKLEELKIMFLEEEIKELRHFQREAKNRTAYLTQVLEQSEEQRKRQHGIIESMRYQLTQAGMYSNLNQLPAGEDPLSHPETRPNSLPEAEAIIRHLHKLNEQQSHELDRMKSDLRDVLYSHKWTPDAYLIAKAYIAEDDLKVDSGNGQNGLPRLQIKSKSRKLPDIAYIQKDNVTLPALKHSVSNKAMERKKRTQILQKARLH